MDARAAERIRVVTVEDDARYRASLEILFRHSADFLLTESFGSPVAALERLAATGSPPGWDLILMDLDMPVMSGVECTRRIKERIPGVPVVVLTVLEGPLAHPCGIRQASGAQCRRSGGSRSHARTRVVLGSRPVLA